nr:hypothetical protein Iba_chr06dCG9790 [Ipomoea batatas]
MRRTRATTSKRRREEGESSRQGEERNDNEEVNLAQDEVIPRRVNLQGQILVKFEHFKAKSVIAWNYIDPPILDYFGCQEVVSRLTNQPYWSQIFEWRDDTFNSIVYEFVATLEITGRPKDLRGPTTKFRVFNTNYHISVNELRQLLGIYTPEE